ncbi:unnamed protein product [Plutella xylostella]|uniref:(diamondback moth) hypothetical protein n=1 Tax=Plutella xylostella TaxID=51655 RepID=A0A8S4EII9_PLUXY|nr:unnamed protein product [Plutella xylostella]
MAPRRRGGEERVDEVSCTYLVAGGSSGDQEKAAGFQTLAWRHVLDRSEIRAIQSTAALNTHTGILRLAPDSGAVSSLESVSMIGPELCGLGPAWAPFIAPWCIKLLVDIATEKANLPNVTLQNSDPVRVLLDITTQNLTLLDSEERSKCIDMMLSCRFCSWAVGWVGRAEPALVAPRALALGADAARAVLAHLANHAPALLHVREALLQLFHEAISTDSKPDKRRDVIPYLLNLASKSDIVLKALIQDIDKTLTDTVMERLTAVCAGERHGPAWEAVGPAALVALLQRADIHCFLLLLRQAAKYLFCRQLTEYLLQKLEIESLLPDKKIPLLQSASEEMFVLRETVLTGSQLEQYSAARIIILVCYNLPSEFVNTISYLLQYSRNDTTLALLVRIISGTITMHTPNDSPDINMDTERYQNLIKTGIEYALRESMHSDTVIKKCYVDGTAPKDRKTYTHHFCLNIIKLLRWESSGRVPHMAVWSVSASAGAGAAALGGALGGRASALRERVPCEPAGRMQAHALAEVLDKLDFSGNKLPPPSVEVIIKVIQATVKYFFMCLHEEEIMDKLRGTQRACRLLRKLCLHSKLARAIALRDLLETAMFREEATFGSKNFIGNTTSAALDWANDDLLMHLNQKHGPITQLTQSHTSVFHAGIIGKGVRRVNADEQNEIPDILTTNNELLMGALMSCMDGNSGIVEGMTAVSLLLVELISPDVMYNGLPWPDEDFTKQVSIERELYMRAALEGCVVARAALRRAAQHRPALCLASALLRACAASALHRHRAADARCCGPAPPPRCTATAPPTVTIRAVCVTVHTAQHRPALCLASALLRACAASALHRHRAADARCCGPASPPRCTATAPPTVTIRAVCVTVHTAQHRPALCLASALLRACAASALHRHRAADARCCGPAPPPRCTATAPPTVTIRAVCVTVHTAQHRPALCLASALLRACAASALHRHRAADDRYCMSAEMRRERSALSELLATMSLGQLLPPPLCHMLQLAPALTSSELVQILRDCLWNYTRDNVPSPALFECDATGLHWRDPASCAPPPSYTDALRIIIQKRIARLGHLYPLMFLNLEKSLHRRDPASCAPPPSYTDALRIIIQKRIARLGHLYPLMFLNLEKSLHWRAPASCVPPPSYTDALRIIIQKRIARLGHLYPLMFLNLEKNLPAITDVELHIFQYKVDLIHD